MGGRKKSAPALKLVLPATSANLGPAFDAAALAFDLFLKVEARTASEFSIHARGLEPEICGALDNHLILTTYREVLEGEGREVRPLSLRLDNAIPIGKGCGSSASARLAGIALAVHFGRLAWPNAKIVGEASRREHHPDNAAACWMGGLAVARMNRDEAQVARIKPKGSWPLLMAVPEVSLSTEKARQVLPEHYFRGDVVINVQNSMLLLAGFALGKKDLVASALEDRLHQPYRAELCPLLPALQQLRGTPGILGAVLSGAGPSVLVFLDPQVSPLKTRTMVATHLLRMGLSAELILTKISERGAQDSPGWKNRG